MLDKRIEMLNQRFHRTRLDELAKRDWSAEAYKKAIEGKTQEEAEEIGRKWDNDVYEYYLKDTILAMAMDLFGALSELHELLKVEPNDSNNQ